MSAPDLLLGFDAPPEKRNIFGLIAEQPELAKKGIGLRKFGQDLIAVVAGHKIHPDFCVPGDVNRALASTDRDALSARIADAKSWVHDGLTLLRGYLEQHREFVAHIAIFPSYYLCLTTPDGDLEHYGGLLRVKDCAGKIVEDRYDPANYLSLIAEATEDWSYLNFPFYRPSGYPQGS